MFRFVNNRYAASLSETGYLLTEESKVALEKANPELYNLYQLVSKNASVIEYTESASEEVQLYLSNIKEQEQNIKKLKDLVIDNFPSITTNSMMLLNSIDELSQETNTTVTLIDQVKSDEDIANDFVVGLRFQLAQSSYGLSQVLKDFELLRETLALGVNPINQIPVVKYDSMLEPILMTTPKKDKLRVIHGEYIKWANDNNRLIRISNLHLDRVEALFGILQSSNRSKIVRFTIKVSDSLDGIVKKFKNLIGVQPKSKGEVTSSIKLSADIIGAVVSWINDIVGKLYSFVNKTIYQYQQDLEKSISFIDNI